MEGAAVFEIYASKGRASVARALQEGPVRRPLVVSYGAGVDSTAMLVAMFRRRIRPDLILFADTGGELPETYGYLPIINAWLASVGFPLVTVVRYRPRRAPYSTLEDKCLANQTLPSLAFGRHSCSLVFKVEPQNRFLQSWEPALEAWAGGARILKAIGYDNGDQDCRRRRRADKAVAKKAAESHVDAERFEYWYPLQEWGIDRVGCLRLIASAGLPKPLKSACFFCPASKKSEIIWLRDTHPVLFHRALKIEKTAKEGKHGLSTVVGLGRSFAWSTLVRIDATTVIEEMECLRP
jgi:hypothetical protein